jgi:HK97 family phage prohead protease
VFNKESRNLGGFIEIVTPSFFNKSRGDGWPDVMARYNHDDNQLLGTTASGMLALTVDDVGLDYTVIPPKSRSDVVELVQRGDVRKSSFAFRVRPTVDGSPGDDWGMSEQGYPLRKLLSGQLVDVAPVNTPAYPDSSTQLRALEPEEQSRLKRLGIGPEAALRSLADRMSADITDVLELAEADELRKFFIRTDGPSPVKAKPTPRLFGPAAAAQLLSRKADPWG